MKKNCKEILTIREIINSLNNVMTGSANITLDSPVIITDVNLQEFEATGVHTIKDIYYGEDKVGIYIKPKEVTKNYEEEKEIIEHEILGKEIEETRLGNSEVQTGNNWWEKYK